MSYSLQETLSDFDPDLWSAMSKEAQRQEDHLELIASENYTSPLVLQAQGSILTNKYAEGYPNKRYYGGCEYVDIVEQLAIDRAKQLFQADYANVQTHSGSQANAAAYMALLEPGDSLLGMNLAHGGHLTHGAKVSFSGKIYQAYAYGITADTQLIDYVAVEALAKKHRPKLIIAGFSAYSRVVDWQRFRDIADEVGAYFLVDMAHVAGLVAAGLYPSPLPIADVVTTTTHKTLRGPRGGLILARANPEIEKKLNSAVFPGQQGGPLMHVIAGKAVAFKEALSPSFKLYQQQVIKNAKGMVQVMLQRNYKIVSGGTDNHLFLIDLIKKKMTDKEVEDIKGMTDKEAEEILGISGKKAEEILGKAYITVNKNMLPNDLRSPFVTSGLRIGTPAITTRGLKEKEVQKVANWICDILDNPYDLVCIDKIKEQVIALCQEFPVYSP